MTEDNRPRPRNRIRPTSQEAKAERDKAQQALNALGAKLALAYVGIVVAFIAGAAAGSAWL